MSNEIGVGLIVGAVAASSIYIWNSKYFTKTQKTFLIAFCVFAPLQWIIAPLLYFYNRSNSNNFSFSDVSLDNLKEKGVLTKDEYDSKKYELKKIELEKQVLNSKEYKQLKDLYKKGLFDEKTFNEKVSIIKNDITESQHDKKAFFPKIIFSYSDTYNDEIKLLHNNGSLYQNVNYNLLIGKWNTSFGEITLHSNMTATIVFDNNLLFKGGWEYKKGINRLFIHNKINFFQSQYVSLIILEISQETLKFKVVSEDVIKKQIYYAQKEG